MKDAQLQMRDIRFDKIRQNDVKNLIKKQMTNGVLSFGDLRETYDPGVDLSEHKIHVKEYFINGPLDKVWKHYTTANPSEVWNGEMISFGLMVSGSPHEIVYPNEKYSGAKPGQVFYVSLKIFGGLINIAISHKIIGVNHDEKIMTLSYVEGGETEGMQKIQLTQSKEGTTKITHTTYYKGRSAFREKWLYPWFHSKAIDEFHANLRNSFKLL